jgi:hypothetical protein
MALVNRLYLIDPKLKVFASTLFRRKRKREEKIINAISSTNGNFTVRDLKK